MTVGGCRSPNVTVLRQLRQPSQGWHHCRSSLSNRGSSGFLRVLQGLVLGASVPDGPPSSQGLPLFKTVQYARSVQWGLSSELKLERQGGKTKIRIPFLFFLRVPPALPLFSHPCRPEEGVFYGKHGPPSGFDRGSKLITGLAGAESTSGAKGAGGDFWMGGGDSTGVLGSSEKILVAAIVPEKLLEKKKEARQTLCTKWHCQ